MKFLNSIVHSIILTGGSFLALLASPHLSDAAQRMGIAQGTYSIHPNGTTRVESYCMDYTRAAPSKGTSYGHVLTDARSTSVRFGTGPGARTLPLQEALDKHLIAIEGSNLDADRIMEMLSNDGFLTRLGPEERAQAKQARELYGQLSTSERQDLLGALQQALGSSGDFTGLNFRNNTRDPAEIIVSDRPMILGTAKEGIDLLDSSGIARRDQKDIWEVNTRRHKQMLKECGVDEIPNGEDPFTAQIERFQAILDLPKTKELDGATEVALKRASGEQERVSAFNAEAENYAYVTFESGVGGATEFRVFFGKGEEIYRGTSLNDALRRANDRAAAKANGRNLYVDLGDFGPTRAGMMGENLIRLQREMAPDRELHVIDRARLSMDEQILLFESGIKRATPGDIEQIATGERKGWYRLSVDFVKQTGQKIRVYILSASRRALEVFQSRVMKRLSAPSSRSPLDEIIFIKEELKKQGISPEEIRVELENYNVASAYESPDGAACPA